jgi:hypothetical protein
MLRLDDDYSFAPFLKIKSQDFIHCEVYCYPFMVIF